MGVRWELGGTYLLPWTCQASGNLDGPANNRYCTGRVTGFGDGHSEEDACRNAKRDAVHRAPRGCYARHLRCFDCHKR